MVLGILAAGAAAGLADYMGLPITQALPYVMALRDEHGLIEVSGLRFLRVTGIERGVGGFRAQAR